MILSTEDCVIVDYENGVGNSKIEGTKLLHCKAGDEEKCVRLEDKNLEKAKITRIKRQGTIKIALQKKASSIK